MYPIYNATGGWTNEYDFAKDWNLDPHNIWVFTNYIQIKVIANPRKSYMALYLPFHIKFGDDVKDIEICKK